MYILVLSMTLKGFLGVVVGVQDDVAVVVVSEGATRCQGWPARERFRCPDVLLQLSSIDDEGACGVFGWLAMVKLAREIA